MEGILVGDNVGLVNTEGTLDGIDVVNVNVLSA